MLQNNKYLWFPKRYITNQILKEADNLDTIYKQIDVFVSDNKSKKNNIIKDNHPKVLELFGELFDKNEQMDKIIEQLLKINIDFTLVFLDKFISYFKQNNKLDEFNQCLLTANYKNISMKSTRIFVIVDFYIKNELNSIGNAVLLCDVIYEIQQESGFTTNVCEIFDKKLIKPNYNNKYSFLLLDFSEVEKRKLQILCDFVLVLSESEIIDINNPILTDWVKAYDVKLSVKQSLKESKTENVKLDNKNKSNDIEKSLFNTIIQADKSITQMVSALSESFESVQALTQEVNTVLQLNKDKTYFEEQKKNLDETIQQQSISIEEKTKEITMLQEKLNELQTQIDMNDIQEQNIENQKLELEQANLKINDLELRLKKSLEQDAISENQELITLKKELARNLQLAYEDYTESSNQDYSQEQFDAYKSILKGVFRTLNRHGVEFTEE